MLLASPRGAVALFVVVMIVVCVRVVHVALVSHVACLCGCLLLLSPGSSPFDWFDWPRGFKR